MLSPTPPYFLARCSWQQRLLLTPGNAKGLPLGRRSVLLKVVNKADRPIQRIKIGLAIVVEIVELPIIAGDTAEPITYGGIVRALERVNLTFEEGDEQLILWKTSRVTPWDPIIVA
ncbi:hypothetical protein MA16_Dca022359 [Dendrobium catenatum]|uniref:Uncharacterized protein n=1 Tax=Dendrobium catenatum TaxID=906689 RepID=A0A2I0VVF7_9ASPA|nr:hypothetical protein MA16_Dca022359 [Dendrobium catenatum]